MEVPEVTIKQEKDDNFALFIEPNVNENQLKIEPEPQWNTIKTESCSDVAEVNNLDQELESFKDYKLFGNSLKEILSDQKGLDIKLEVGEESAAIVKLEEGADADESQNILNYELNIKDDEETNSHQISNHTGWGLMKGASTLSFAPGPPQPVIRPCPASQNVLYCQTMSCSMDQNGSATQINDKKAKLSTLNAERCRRYRQRKKLALQTARDSEQMNNKKAKRLTKTNAERCRKYRQRKKLKKKLSTLQNASESTAHNSVSFPMSVTSSGNVLDCQTTSDNMDSQ